MRPIACLLMALVLAHCRDQPAPETAPPAGPTASEPPADSLPPDTPGTVAGPQPEVWFVPVVSDVLLRRQPSPGAARAGRLGPSIRWNGEASAHRDTIALRGRARPYPWYRVVQPDSSLAWVYGGTVRPGLFDFRPLGAVPVRSSNAWIALERIAAERFAHARRAAGADTLRRFVPVATAPPLTRLHLRRGERVYNDVLTNGENHRDHAYIAQQGGYYLLQRRFYEWWDLLFVREDDGSEYETFGGADHVPVPAPGFQRWAWPARQGHEGKVPFYEGVEIFDAVAGRSVAVQLGDVADLVWESPRAVLLARRTPDQQRSYYRLTLLTVFE